MILSDKFYVEEIRRRDRNFLTVNAIQTNHEQIAAFNFLCDVNSGEKK
jgi:hypothetical protein